MNNQVMVLDIPSTISGHHSLVNPDPQPPTGQSFLYSDFAILKGTQVVRHCQPVKIDYYNISLCLNGGCKKSVGQFIFEVYPSSIHFVTPGKLHSHQLVSDDFHVYQVLFRKEFLSDSILRENMLENLVSLNEDFAPIFGVPDKALQSIKSIYEKISDEVSHGGPFHLQIIRLLILELLYEVNRVCEKCLQNSNRQTDRQFQLVSRYKKLINEHFREMKTVQEYASLLFVSSKYLTQVVKSQIGENALHLIHKRLAEEAKYLLSTTTLSVKQVAGQLNFETSSHFCRFFKRSCGFNPGTYRSGDH
ncbi:helix-turn-helix domain-containing protein [Mucilaginibacter sp. 22184]|uniref:helix-turn-helix domain-containing protein n=1 Tax=Mucilaginibacter sp. 22184 TaxID=3453887 RepID=UPI003F84B779